MRRAAEIVCTTLRQADIHVDGFETEPKVLGDHRVSINISEGWKRFSDLLTPALRKLPDVSEDVPSLLRRLRIEI